MIIVTAFVQILVQALFLFCAETIYFLFQSYILNCSPNFRFSLSSVMAVANGVINAPLFGRFSVEKQESLLKITILSIAAILAFSTRLFSVLR